MHLVHVRSSLRTFLFYHVNVYFLFKMVKWQNSLKSLCLSLENEESFSGKVYIHGLKVELMYDFSYFCRVLALDKVT